MGNIGREVAKGAAWMVGLRLLQRSLGLVSTVVLARILVPADFGLIAMALSVSGLVELITLLGFDLALIRKTDATRSHFDSAWTLGILFRTLASVVLAGSATAVSVYYDDPRLVDIIYVYAFVTFISGFENIGIVVFRKDFKFNQEFRFQLTKKLLAVIGTVAMAFYFRSYWALVLGTLFSQLIAVLLSYWMHSYRPRFDVSAWREMLGFSAWVVFNNLMLYARKRGSDFIIGPILGAQALGSYRVAKEIAALPTTELTMPIMRSVFPGFSKIKDDKERLRKAYLLAQGGIAVATLPTCAALFVLAEQCVYLLLGPKWMSIVLLVKICTLYGALKILQGNRHALLMAVGKPYWIGIMVVAEVLVALPMIYFFLKSGGGIETAAWASVFASIVILPLGLTLVSKTLGLRRYEFLAVIWRPGLATVGMGAALYWLRTLLPPPESVLTALWTLALCVAVGVTAYITAILVLWMASGKPDGVERRLLSSVPVTRALNFIGLGLLQG